MKMLKIVNLSQKHLNVSPILFFHFQKYANKKFYDMSVEDSLKTENIFKPLKIYLHMKIVFG
jgi:hypothetical protein